MFDADFVILYKPGKGRPIGVCMTMSADGVSGIPAFSKTAAEAGAAAIRKDGALDTRIFPLEALLTPECLARAWNQVDPDAPHG